MARNKPNEHNNEPNPHGGRPAHSKPMTNVCKECNYYGGDHGPKCSQNPANRRP